MTSFRTTRLMLVLRTMVIGSSLFLIGSAEAQSQQDATPGQQPDKIVATQDTTPAATPATTPPEPTWSAGPIDFSGLVDGYYDANFNHPSTMDNQLRNFDEKASQFSLNMMKVTMQHDPDPVGFRVDLGFGRAFTTIHASEQAPQIFQYLEQAYISLKPPKAKGFEADFGEFVTSAGAEVIETKDNWNYSRSLLFAWAIPYYHFGLRTSMPLTKTITGGVQVVNGWNDVEDNNSGKTVGVTGVLTKPKYALNVNYYVGPEKPNTNKGYRNLIDSTLTLYPTSKVGVYLNYDYAQERSLTNVLDHYQGFAGAARFQLTKTIAIAPRAEIFNDPQGFSTGTPQQLEEFTLTGEYKIAEGFLSRVEYRRDHSDQFFFQRGTTPNGSQNQSTILVGMVVYYGPKR
jgi:predicted porin